MRQAYAGIVIDQSRIVCALCPAPSVLRRHSIGRGKRCHVQSSMFMSDEGSLKADCARASSRTVYDFADWQKHRSSYRFIERLLQVPRSNVLQNCLPIVAWVMAVATGVVAYSELQVFKCLPEWLPILIPNAACTTFIAQTSVALSLLLVFRTNAAYGRWDEARKLWGNLLNRSRDLARQAVTYFPDEHYEAKKSVCRWTVAIAHILRHQFQPDDRIDVKLQGILNKSELEFVASAVHQPVQAIHVLSQVVQNVPISSVLQAQMSQNISQLEDVLGGCERLFRAPIPVSYTRHTARFLFVWLTLLPFALLPTCSWATVPLTGAIAAVLAAIEEIGVQVEEPFGVLPLETICRRIQIDVTATLQTDQRVKKIVASTEEVPMPNGKEVSVARFAPITITA